MRSTTKTTADGFDLELGLRLTAADLEALDRARDIQPLDFEKYLQWLNEITAGGRQRRELAPPDSPFEL
jgi:hypothetical protein